MGEIVDHDANGVGERSHGRRDDGCLQHLHPHQERHDGLREFNFENSIQILRDMEPQGSGRSSWYISMEQISQLSTTHRYETMNGGSDSGHF